MEKRSLIKTISDRAQVSYPLPLPHSVIPKTAWDKWEEHWMETGRKYREELAAENLEQTVAAIDKILADQQFLIDSSRRKDVEHEKRDTRLEELKRQTIGYVFRRPIDNQWYICTRHDYLVMTGEYGFVIECLDDRDKTACVTETAIDYILKRPQEWGAFCEWPKTDGESATIVVC